MRAFVAISFDEPLRRRIGEIRRELERAGADVRWVSTENLHLTLKFLGDVEEVGVAAFRERLRVVASRFSPLNLDLGGVGRFPRVLWVGCAGDVPRLIELAHEVERAALEIGVPEENRPFSPHLTIGRLKSPRCMRTLDEAVEARRNEPVGRQRVDRFTLYRSTLTPKGPIYDAIESFPMEASE